MKISKISHVLSLKKEANRWTPYEDFLLEMLVGKESYTAIALKLGRTPGAVQRRASRKRLSALSEAAEDAQTRRDYYAGLQEAFLRLSEADLAQYVPTEVPEDPVQPVPGSREYHRHYKRAQRERGKETG